MESKCLKRSWTEAKTDKPENTSEESLSEQFEREVLSHAKGSIATVLRSPEPTARNPSAIQPARHEHSAPPLKPPATTQD
jgi:hypothetical protein